MQNMQKMQKNTDKCREMQRHVEKCRETQRSVEKCREMQLNVEKCRGNLNEDLSCVMKVMRIPHDLHDT